MRNVRTLWLGILILCGSSYAATQEIGNVLPENDGERSNQAELRDAQTNNEPDIAGSELAPGVAEPAAKKESDPEDNNAQRDAPDHLAEKDLLAQRIMAACAVVLLAIGVGQLYLSRWGITLLNATLEETRNAAKASAVAANATMLAAEAAVAQAQQGRPWIIPVHARAERHMKDRQWHYTIQLVSKNVGATPAVKISAQIQKGPILELGAGKLTQITAQAPIHSFGAAMHNSVMGIDVPEITEQELRQICGSKVRLFVRLVMQYHIPGSGETPHLTDVTVAIGMTAPLTELTMSENFFHLDATMIGGFVELT